LAAGGKDYKGTAMNHTNATTFIIKEANRHESRVLKDFIRLPYRLYRDNPYWVPPLISEEKRFLSKKHNPFLEKNPVVFYVCYRGKTPVGRIAGIINREHNNYHKDKTAFFGFFESIDDHTVAGLLFEAVARWVKEQGADALRGPTNFTINDVSAMLLDGFDEVPFLMMPYNPAYYEKLYRENGFDIAMRVFAYEVTQDTIKFPKLLDRLDKRLENNEIQIRNLNFKKFDSDFKIIVDIFNRTWDKNWGFTPISYEEAVEEFKKVKVFVRPDLIFIAEHKGEPAGFALALPDINQVLKPLQGRLLPFNWIKLLWNLKKINRIRVVLMGVLEKYRSKGIDLMFYKKIVDNSLRHDYYRAELSWILENNLMMNRVLQHINARRSKVYAIFEKIIK
jgi:GNAT superfamily N-acetyltransferase